jgi:formamidopyrimidine-DNA glycosylase
VPELPEVEAVRRELAPAMCGARFQQVIVRRAGLRAPFPDQFAARLSGRTVRALTRRGKYLLANLSSGETLLMHLGMSGSFHVARRAASTHIAIGKAPADETDPHDHVMFRMSSGSTITFNDPRRFGVMDLIPTRTLAEHPVLGVIGPEPLSRQFDPTALARACAGRKTALKVALLDQHVVAGLGNIYASEALHLARLSPWRRASGIATPSGVPRQSAVRLARAIKTTLERAIARQTRQRYRSARFRVYDRAGEACVTPGCRGTIRRSTQAGRSTFYCPVCQTGEARAATRKRSA